MMGRLVRLPGNATLELYQLRTFLAVAETRHLTRAAERVHLSQPAVSAQLKALEEELGVQLFERLHGGMELTVTGGQLLQHAERVLGAAEELREAAGRLRGSGDSATCRCRWRARSTRTANRRSRPRW